MLDRGATHPPSTHCVRRLAAVASPVAGSHAKKVLVSVVPSQRARAAAGFATTAVLAILLTGCVGKPHDPSAATPPPSGRHRTESGWTVTVYYTAVEYFHDGQHEQVRGCPRLDCAGGDVDLGAYPASFVTAVHDEGAGRITHGAYAGKYLNWAFDVGYWLDDLPRDTFGRPLVPFRTAAADGLPAGSPIRLLSCGTSDEGMPPPPDVCLRLSGPTWLIRDAFTPGFGGNRHIDLYIGEEDRRGFTETPLYTTLHNVLLQIN